MHELIANFTFMAAVLLAAYFCSYTSFACPIGSSPSTPLPSEKAPLKMVLLMSIIFTAAFAMLGVLPAMTPFTSDAPHLSNSESSIIAGSDVVLILLASLLGSYRGNQAYAAKLCRR